MSRIDKSRRRSTSARLATWIIAVSIAVLAAVVGLAVLPWPRETLAPRNGPALAAARAWGYQLQYFNPVRIPAEIDVMVVDYSRDGSARREIQRAEVEALRAKPDGGRRIVLAYVSVGEAETYRFYWRAHWSRLKPAWLGPENAKWKGNFPVRFWEPGWQRLIVSPDPTALIRLAEFKSDWRKPYVDRILEAGFDGVYLDRVDAFYDWKAERGAAEQDMIALVEALSRYARARKPGFLVVAQNGEELLEHQRYRRAIDGVAKEDLMFGVDGPERRNRPQDYLRSINLLRRAHGDGLKVMVVEYVQDPVKREEARARMAELGFLLLFTERGLNKPPETPAERAPGTRLGESAPAAPAAPAGAFK